MQTHATQPSNDLPTAHPGQGTERERVLVFDTTLRDGEQAPGIALNPEEKLRIARQLARLGVDVMEAGFPVTSGGDFEAVRMIAQQVEGPVICALARTEKRDIDTAWQALRDAERARIDIVTSSSDIHIEYQLNSTREDVKGQVRAAVAHARSYTDDVEISPMDTTRSDVEYLAELIQVAIEAGASTVDLPDTVGYAMPHEFGAMIDRLYELVPELHGVTLSVHCHDDLGLAVANSLAGVVAGARQVHCTVNGIGERAGNASLEELVMLLRMRGAEVGLDTGVDTTEIMNTSRLVAELTGFAVPPNKAIVGRNAFLHEAGIHQDGVLKNRATYEIIDAATVGLTANNSIVLGKHSGRHGLRQVLHEMGYEVEGHALNRAFARFKELADEKKTLDRTDLEALLDS
jgi:2-isopropylmalate synthase